MRDAVLCNAVLSAADLSGANLEFADLSGADLSNITIDDISILLPAKGLEYAKMNSSLRGLLHVEKQRRQKQNRRLP